MSFSISVLIALFVTALLCIAGIEALNLINKRFGIRTSTFGRTAVILVLSTLSFLVLSAIGLLLGVSIFRLFAALAFYGTAYALYRKYFSTGFWKFFLIMLVNSVAWIVLAVVILVPIVFARVLFFEPFVVTGDSMAPAYPSGEYLIIEKYDRSVQKGDAVIATINSEQNPYFVIARVTGITGDTVNGTTIPSGDVYLSKDNPSATSTRAWTIPQTAIVGKPILDFGHTNW